MTCNNAPPGIDQLQLLTLAEPFKLFHHGHAFLLETQEYSGAKCTHQFRSQQNAGHDV